MPCIYKITNSVNGKVYIGQTVKSAKERFREHKYFATRPDFRHCKYLHNAIAKYGAENFTLEVVEECPKELLDEREIYWIDKYDSYNNGYNLTIGGGGNQQAWDTATIQKHWDEGMSITDIANKIGRDRECVGRELKRLGISPSEIKKRCSQVLKEKNRQKIYQYDLNGNFICEFASIYDAEEILGISRHSIRNASNGSHPVSGGYQWRRYKADNIGKAIRHHICNRQSVYCVETDTVYRSINEASRTLGIEHHIISKYLRGERKDNKWHFTVA